MRAIHVNSLAPLFAKNAKDCKPEIEKFDLFNTVLSALTWRKYNGEIELICDRASAGYYENLGIARIWNGIKPIIPDNLEGINPLMFWAAGKLLALRETPSPAVMLDTDFIVWKKLTFTDAIIAAHREDLYPDVYPDVSYFQMNAGYTFNEAYDYNQLPLNTAFLYLPDEDFKQFYVNMAIEFMKSAQSVPDNLCYMVYAEQRLLAMCAKRLNMRVETLLDKDKLFAPQDDFTHLWGAKQEMREDKSKEQDFINRCKARIRRDFPEYAYIINLIDMGEK